MTTLDRRHFIAGAIAASSFGAVRNAFAQTPTGPHTLPALKYAVGALEPHIDARTMEIHHGRHHQAYVNNLNAALKDHGQLAQLPLRELIARLAEIPESIRTAVRNNGGGHANHAMFWEIMGTTSGNPSGDLATAIDRDFGGLDKLKEQFNGAGARVFGSGWAFVTVDRTGKLAIAAKPNQDTPLMEGQCVLIGNDVWEHAYYLKYQNRRADYLAAWWNVVDWSVVGTRYAAAKAGTLEI